MNLTARDKDKLLAAMAAEVARKRLARGVRLNHAEAIALISDVVVEGAREGRSVDELAQAGARVLAAHQVMDGIAAMVREVEVEATFPDGIRSVTVRDPIPGGASTLVPGEIVAEAGEIEMNAHRAVSEVEVENAGDRPIRIGSHYHFAEANPALRFDRDAALGKRLDAVPGTFVRFEPGQRRTVRLIDVGGAQEIVGFRGEAEAPSGD